MRPDNSKNRVNKAGVSVRAGNSTDEDIAVIENWRASHSRILNDWQSILRTHSEEFDVIFAQRLKRKVTIFDKLTRYSGMKFATMHDIAGCRLIFKNMSDLDKYREKLHNNSPWIKHKRRKANEDPDPYDYVRNPHPSNSGYRGVHDVYEYVSKSQVSKDWNGLFVEIQYRTTVQHAWATANEIAGSMTGYHSKFGRGTEEQHEFFRLTSEIIARAEEGRKSCYPDLTNETLCKLFNDIEKDTHLLQRLQALKTISGHEGLNLFKQNVILVHQENNKIKVFNYSTFPRAREQYFELEEKYGEKADVVLVRTPTVANLKEAYRNYFSDTSEFVNLVKRGLGKLQ